METKLDKMRREAKERLNKLKHKQLEVPSAIVSVVEESILNNPEQMEKALIQRYGFNPYVMDNGLILNDRQREAVDKFGLQGLSGCLIGPAGTGKTTTMRAVIRASILSNRVPIIDSADEHKYIPTEEAGIWGGSFTRIATRNLRDNFPADLQNHVHTIHRLLEFEPKGYEVADDKNPGKVKKIKVFEPLRGLDYQLPQNLKSYFFDEASMVGCELHAKWERATKFISGVQAVYIGDIAQLPPVMDDSILGYKLLELPVVELNEVYRHAGAIVELANHIRVGKTIPFGRDIIPYINKPTKAPKELIQKGIDAWNKEEDGSKVTIHLWKNRLEGEVGQLRALQSLGHFKIDSKNEAKSGYGFFPKELKEGRYNPLKHMILIPYNKAVGTLELNKYIAQYLGKHRVWKDNKGVEHTGAIVHEVIASYEKLYLAEGDKIFYDREEAIITKINKNGTYSGKIPQVASVSLDRWGHNQVGQEQTLAEDEFSSIDNLLFALDTGIDEDERKNQASHTIHVKKLVDFDDPEAKEYILNTSGEVKALLFGYALTVHKAQGSQWEKVYCIFHNSHNRNLQRELLYTAITRAQKELYVVCEPETFIQGVLSQHIIGNTLTQKAEYFKGKKVELDRKKDLFNKAKQSETVEIIEEN